MSIVLLWTIISAVGFTLCLVAVWVNFQTYLYAREALTTAHVTVARGQVRRSFMRWLVLGIFFAAGLTVYSSPLHAGWIREGLVAAAGILVLQEALDAVDRV